MGTLLAESPTFAVEEAIGRFYENIIGRSKGFWQYIYEPLTDILPQLKTYVGFFPSYFMANVTAAQMAAVMAQEIGDLDQLMQQQSFGKINDWLTQNMYCYGAVYSGRELMEKVCRGTFSSTYYIDYLRNKYSEVYKLF